MSRLLRDNDYLRQIQADNLDQIIESRENTRTEVEQSAQAEMISYLVQRYRTVKIFTDTTVFDISATYFGKNLIEYTETAYDITVGYSTNDRVLQDGKIYKSIAGNAAHAFVPAEWTFIVNDKSLFYAKTNEQEYINTTAYVLGDLVWYDDIVYTAKSGTTGNLPTDTSFWTAGATYSFSGAYPDDSTKWINGDNRNQQIVMYLIDITLYHLHARINPRNVPELRMIRYDGNNPTQNGGAIGWLKKVSTGDVTADIENLIPESGISIQWDSNPQNDNLY